MEINKSSKNIAVLLIIFAVGFGCKFLPSGKTSEIPAATPAELPATRTVITKDILKQRLGSKGIETTSEFSSSPPLKPNPTTLHLRFSNSNDTFKLNQDEVESFGELVNKLKEIFRYREENGVFREGTNETEKTITLPAYDDYIAEYNTKDIYVEDFEKLVDDLRKENFEQIVLDLYEENSPITLEEPARVPGRINVRDGKSEAGNDSSSTNPMPKTISGGVVNGKASNLVKPPYPPAAKAVRAAGAVNVQVTIDEEGNVISASAVSGHPLLKAAAVQAARASKFNPTMLGGKPVKVSGIIVYNFSPE